MSISKTIFMVSWIGAVSLACASAGFAGESYASPLGWTIDYPSEWKNKETEKVVLFISPQKSGQDPFVSLVVEDLSGVSPMPPLVDYQAASLESTPKQIADFRLLEQVKTEVAGEPAFVSEFFGTRKGVRLRFKVYTFFHETSAYRVTYTAREEDYERLLAEGEAIIRSIRFTAPAVAAPEALPATAPPAPVISETIFSEGKWSAVSAPLEVSVETDERQPSGPVSSAGGM